MKTITKQLLTFVFIFFGFSLNAQNVISLTLIDAASNTDITSIEEGSIINLAEVGIALNVRANVSGTVGSVVFDYDEYNIGTSGTANRQVESVAPYAMRGDNSGDYRVWTPSVGEHTITATSYSEASGGGAAGTPYVINFTVINDDSAPAVEYDLPAGLGSGAVSQTGELKKWHKITLSFEGPTYSETANAPSPFLDYCLEVTFTNGEESYVIPGYFAADGDAAETSASEGNIWRVHFTPSLEGDWTWTASMRLGDKAAIADDNSAAKAVTSIDGKTGKLTVSATDKSGRDLRAKGRLQYVGEHYLKFAETGKYFIKGGPDAPENMLAYEDFDGEFKSDGIADERVKSWSTHADDWNAGDPSWQSGKGTELIGAVNYLASEGLNVFSFLTMNIGGDDKNVYPYISNNDFKHFDCSKLDQWGILFDHAMEKGMYLHFKTQETENETLLDAGNLGVNRKLYYRELIARYGYHLALNWNLGEENSDQSDAQRKTMAQYFKDKDPYGHHIVIHSYPNAHEKIYRPLIGNKSEITGASIQTAWNNVHSATSTWVQDSRDAGKKWVVANDEQGSAKIGVPHDSYSGTPNLNDIRKQTLWGNLMAGGAGVEYYFGYDLPHSDLDCQDFRSRDMSWDYVRHAINFFESNELPLQQMLQKDNLTNNAWCYASEGQVYLVYLKDGGTTNLTINQDAAYTVKWYDPRNGGELKDGSVTSISGTGEKALGSAPDNASEDWLVLVTNASGINLVPSIVATASASKGTDTLTVSFDATGTLDEDGTVVSYSWDFGDAQEGVGMLVSHTYTAPGTYTAILTVEDNNGGVATKEFVISIVASAPATDCGKPEMMLSKDFPLNNYYLDDYTGQNILAITPGTSPVSAITENAFLGESCTYDIIFHGVGENDGQSKFKVFVNDEEVGAYTIPLSVEGYEIAEKYNLEIPNVEINKGDIIKVMGTTGSADGQEWSRARWIKIEFTPTSYLAGDCMDAQFTEKDGIVVMEMESLTMATGWVKKTSPTGFLGDGCYMWDGSDNFSTPGAGIITVKFKINDPGTYHFRWRNKIMHGTENTESNDTWMKILGADDFFGKAGASVKYPKGGMFVQSSTVFAGASKDGWMKVYCSGTTNWTWSSRTSDSDPHEIYATFNKPGVYTMQISGRSRYHAIDRIVLFKDSKYSVSQATSASLDETFCGDDASGIYESNASYDLAQLSIYPNPVSEILNLKNTQQYSTIQVMNVQGQSMMTLRNDGSEMMHVDVDLLPSGLYYIVAHGYSSRCFTTFVKR